MKHKRFLLRSILTAAAVVFVLSGVQLHAQGRYTSVYSRNDVSNQIRELEQSSNEFRLNFDRYLDQSALNGTREEDRLNGIVADFERSLNRLRLDYDRWDTWWESRNNVQAMLREARDVNQMMRSLQFARRIEREWNQMRRDINKLADTYDLPDLGGGTGGGGGGIGGGTSRPPAWAVGTWYWVQGPDRSMTINANGRVTLHTAGNVSTGRFNRGLLYLDGNESTVTRTANGIRTYNRTTGETSDYTRTNTGGGWEGGNASRPPSWAVGTWYWVQGPDRRMSIASDGRVTLNTAGRTSYGTYYNDVITLDGNDSTVTRTRNGIRTYNQSTGETSDYVRRNR